MPFHAERPSSYRTSRSELDRRAIDAAGRVLLGVVRFERSVALRLETFAARADARRAIRQPRQVVMAEVESN